MRGLMSSFLLLILALPLAAQDPEIGSLVTEAELAARPSEEEVSQRSLTLFADLMSPYCPGASLRDCGSGQAEILRNRVRDWIREGKTDQQITDELVAEFGETILGAPRFKGFGTVAYIAPIAALLIGLGVLVAYLRRHARDRAVQPAESSVVPSGKDDGALRRRLEEELKLHSGG